MKYVTIQARNIANMKTVEGYIKVFIELANNDYVKKWVKGQLRNWIINKHTDVSLVKKVQAKDPEWLRKAVLNGEEVYNIAIDYNLQNKIHHTIDFLNTLNRNINYSVEDAFKATEVWDEQRRKAAEKEGLQKIIDREEDGIEEIHKYSDGFRWVKVFGEKSLDREGKLMEHCVGSYYNQVKSGKTKIYSLRDTNNVPHCTVEYRAKSIEQIKGRKNTPVSRKYIDYIQDFLLKNYINYKNIDEHDLQENGYMFDKKTKTLYELNNLPDNFTINGNFYLDEHITYLPNNLTVKGELSIRSNSLKILPENLTVVKGLFIQKADIPNIPDSLNVKGLLYINESKIKTMPKKLVCKEIQIYDSTIDNMSDRIFASVKITISRCTVKNCGSYWKSRIIELTKLNSIPTAIDAYQLDIQSSTITNLPKKLKVNKLLIRNCHNVKNIPSTTYDNLELPFSSIETLPEDTIINGNLNILGSKITYLPKGLVVNGNLNATNSQLSEIHETVVVKKEVMLAKTPIKKLPKSWRTINGSLKLSSSSIEQINVRRVHGGLLLDGCTNITVLPKNVKVNTTVDLSKTKIRELTNISGDSLIAPKTLEKIPTVLNFRYVDFTECTNLTLPDNLTVNGSLILGGFTKKLPNNMTVLWDLDLENTEIKILPSDLNVKGELVLSGSITKLPNNFTLTFLDLSNYRNITTLPNNLTILETLRLNNIISTLPKNLKVKTLEMSYSPIKELPEDIKVDVLVAPNSSLKTIPKSLINIEELILNRSSIETLPDNINCKILELEGTNIKKLPNNLTVTDYLSLHMCKNLKELPSNLKVKKLLLYRTSIVDLPDDLEVDEIRIDREYATRFKKYKDKYKFVWR